MNKICTDLKQSRRLLELGIDANTADMSWYRGTKMFPFELHTKYIGHGTMEGDELIPAWSFSALIELMPKIINFNGEELTLSITIDPTCNEFAVPYKGKYNAINGKRTLKSIDFSDNLIDAAVETIYWLKENKKI